MKCSSHPSLRERLLSCYTGVVHDVMRAAGYRSFVLPPTLRALDAKMRLAGPAYTVQGRTAPADPHQTLLAWTKMLSLAPAGHVLVIQPQDKVAAFMGELSAETLQYKGLCGALVDGGCRDVDFITRIGFPVWSEHATPLDVVGYWQPEQFDTPVRIGEVTVCPGDYLCGDRDGVVVIPAAHVEEIVEEAETAMAKENLVRKAILQGVDPQEAYIRHRKF